jgi:hypothetical protein
MALITSPPRSRMDVILESQIKGAFAGWRKATVFTLADGNSKKWQQIDEIEKSHYVYRPKAKVIRDGSNYYLEVEGMEEMVEVKQVW